MRGQVVGQPFEQPIDRRRVGRVHLIDRLHQAAAQEIIPQVVDDRPAEEGLLPQGRLDQLRPPAGVDRAVAEQPAVDLLEDLLVRLEIALQVGRSPLLLPFEEEEEVRGQGDPGLAQGVERGEDGDHRRLVVRHNGRDERLTDVYGRVVEEVFL